MAETTRTTSGSTGRSPSTPAGNPGTPDSQDAGRALAADARNMGNELLAAVRDSAGSLFDEQRKRAADEIASLGEALRRTAQSLGEEGQPQILTRYADDAARQIDDFAQTLRNRSWSELSGDVEDFARRWPMAFMASALGVGFLAGRFIAAAAPRTAKAQTNPTEPPRFNAGSDEPRGGARHDYGAVSGSVSGNAMSGYGAAAGREKP